MHKEVEAKVNRETLPTEAFIRGYVLSSHGPDSMLTTLNYSWGKYSS